MSLYNNTFPLVKDCFKKPAVILLSSVKAGAVVRFANEMSVNNLSGQTNPHMGRQRVGSEHDKIGRERDQINGAPYK